MRLAAKSGFQDALADTETYKRGFEAFSQFASEKAQKESGRWVMGWLSWLGKKIATWAVIVGVLYYAGGIAAVLAWMKTKS